MMVLRRALLPLVAFLLGGLLGFVLRPSRTSAPEGGYYVCEKHGHVHEGPGICPVDGEALVPAPTMGSKPASAERKVKYWRSSMDPTFVSKEPGKDNMGMDLVPVYEGDAEAEAGTVVVDSGVVLQMGVRTAVLARGPLVRRIRTVGNVTYDEETLGTVTMKLGGWVEKLHVNKTGQMVKVGDPLFEVYSKELEAAQAAYLESIRDPRLVGESVSAAERGRAEDLLESSRRRLVNWDIPADQIEAIARDGKVHRTVTIRSRFRGVVTHKSAVEGRFFSAGTPLFEIADLGHVWVYAKIYEYERPWVKEGQEAHMTLSYVPGRDYAGVVEYVYPYLNEKTRDITVRMRFPNEDGSLLPGMFANVVMVCSLGTEAVLVPEEAVPDTGVRKLVFLDEGKGRFKAREVSLGVQAAGGMWEVLDGLKAGDLVVVSGQFLLDAESKVREAIQKFLKADDEAKPGEAGEDRKGS
ncbi:MAG: efflux RND transporter periplasmic adaptor subunit [Planctomycetota bacterium]